MEPVRRQIGNHQYCYDKESNTFVLVFSQLVNIRKIQEEGKTKFNIPRELLVYVTQKNSTVLYMSEDFNLQFLHNPRNVKLHHVR